jgi:NADH dehydrogenase FAD-containing subunit
LVTASPDFVERPRLHQLATGQPIASVPLANYLKGSGVRLVVGSVTGIDLVGRAVTYSCDGMQCEAGYDTLVYALGSNIDVASVAGVAEHGMSLIGTEAAGEVRSRLQKLAGRSRPARIVVCGGGLTGMEIATEVAEYSERLRVTLVSASEPGGWLSPKARSYLAEAFDELNVTVQSGVRVRQVQADAVELESSARLPFDLCLWAGGFRAPDLARRSGLAVNSEDRALVDATLRSVSHRDVYVIGDAAAVAGTWGPQLAMGCRTGGYTGPKVADIIAARLTGREPKPFGYRYIHECISLGRRHGLVQFLNADQSPQSHILTGRKAIAYKNAVLNGAKILFRHSGPAFPRRHHIVPDQLPQLSTLTAVGERDAAAGPA